MSKSAFFAFSVAALLCPGSAQALNTRTWIASNGSDVTGCGPVATPCRSLQFAHDQTSAGGEIDVKDSAGYGALTITKSISIVGDGSLAGVLGAPSGNAITINAGTSDAVVLRGLTIEGAGVAANGIVFNTGGSLDVSRCVVQNFIGRGIFLQPSSGSPRFALADTIVSHNNNAGVEYLLPANTTVSADIVIDRVTSLDNFYGFHITASSPSAVTADIANSTAAFNTQYGFYLTGSGTVASIDLSAADRNGFSGFYEGAATLYIGRSVATSNGGYGLVANGGTAVSYKDNRFHANTSGRTSGTIAPGTPD